MIDLLQDAAPSVAIVLAGVLISWQVKRHLASALVALQLFLIVVGAIGFFSIQRQQSETDAIAKDTRSNQERLSRERIVRSKVQAEINRYVCSENNKQDRLLAKILAISLEGADTPAEREKLNAEQRKALAVFLATLRDLQQEAPCTAIVQAFIEASDTDDLEAIRGVLKEQSEPSPPVEIGVGKGKPAK